MLSTLLLLPAFILSPTLHTTPNIVRNPSVQQITKLEAPVEMARTLEPALMVAPVAGPAVGHTTTLLVTFVPYFYLVVATALVLYFATDVLTFLGRGLLRAAAVLDSYRQNLKAQMDGAASLGR